MAANDLITFAEYQEMFDTSIEQKPIIEKLITMVSTRVENLTGRKFIAADKTEYLDSTGTDQIILKEFPINSVTSINIDSSRAFSSTNNLASTDYYLNTTTGIIDLYCDITPVGKKIIKVVYNYGWSIANIPADLKQAVIESVSWNESRYNSGAVGVEQQSAGGMTSRPTMTIPPSAYAVILSYAKEKV